ncbi:hypothetical protein HCN44_002971 [Aphidius gifuensis]|uniref:Disintegrin and metalloproteinase domain-containing protein 12 n=1 Tax=Aphidius gifuensis TaxID=684658 RepID=A0A835CP24_APHGI|nr:hypothetical protein HCN44_002971 [Aphidius gifuensis]
MASDIWRVSNAQNKCSELVLLLRPIVITWWLSTILLQHHHSQAASQTGPSPDFSTYNLVKPRFFHGRTKREISQTKQNDVEHADVLSVGIVIDGVERILDLRLNTDLIPVQYKHTIQVKGKRITEKPDHMNKRAAEEVRGPYNANRQSRYVELVIVIDKKEYIALGQDLKKVHHHCKDIANIINALYTQLNIFIALVGVEVWTETDAITLSQKGDTTLQNFLRYRRQILVKSMPNDNAQLLTRVHFDGGVVGKALKGPICTYEYSGGVSMDHSNVIGLVAATVAHEMGHNFGMEHDTDDCQCPDDRCIMASSSGSKSPTHWSSCSLEYLALAFEHGMDYCLRNKPKKLFGSSICGNGFVESGEQCDCGLLNNCDNPCCNATTCMLHSNASCATGECCDLNTCKPKNAGTQCRSSNHECDLPEYCTGSSEYCPNDVFKIDGDSCSNGKAYCYQGTCKTHTDQCKLLWGPTAWSSDKQCYDTNSKGTKYGNCGFNRLESIYTKCEDDDKLCGMLHCGHYNEKLEFGMESVANLSHTFINAGGSIIACRSVIVDLGLNQVDPGLAPDGSKCATGKMCVNQKCISIANLRSRINNGDICPNNCGGNGVCNSLGHCHCNKGFKPPYCTESGYGGSDDSGPSEDPNEHNAFTMTMYIIFYGILPTSILLYLAWWIKNNNIRRPTWKKDAISTLDCGFTIKPVDRSRGSPHHGLSRNIETIDSSLSQDPACASLLPKSDNDERFNNNLFGQFKGFTLTPLPNSHQSTTQKLMEPTKSAPPPPTIPTVVIQTNIKTAQRSSSLKSAALMSQPSSSSSSSSSNNNDAIVQSLNQNNSRPLISSPVLAATTCTSLELIVGGKIPTRPAPEVPVRPPETLNASSISLSSQPNNIVIENDHHHKKINKDNNKFMSLNRIASMLRPSGIVRSISQPANSNSNNINSQQKLTKAIDKEILKNLKISNPILQNDINLKSSALPIVNSDENLNCQRKNVLMRAQSMRDHGINNKRPIIHSFGSMRVGNKRPISIPASTRPTSPPPPIPPGAFDKTIDQHKIPGLPGYQTPQIKVSAKKLTEDTYDDCMNLAQDSGLTKIIEESPSNDNIYAVIEEPITAKLNTTSSQVNEYKVPKPVETSIYSASTLDKKKGDKKVIDNLPINNSSGNYANTNNYKTPESIYSNASSVKSNSAVSETSSGYLLPSAVNVPIATTNDKSLASVHQTNVRKPVDNLTSTKTAKSLIINSQKLPVKLKDDENIKTNDELSKVVDEVKTIKSPTKESSLILSKQNIIKKEPITKPPLSRTKTPPHINKNLIKNEKDDKVSKTPDQPTTKTVRQGSDTSLKSNKSQSNKERRDSTGSITKNVPLTTFKNKNNSPDVVSSCSKNPKTSESPDVLGNSGKLLLQQQKNQKTKLNKAPIMPSKPGSILTKTSTFNERKKSPVANNNIVKSLTTKDDVKLLIKNDGKLNLASKTSVATLQQKFEQQNKIATINSIKNNNNIVRKTNLNK